MQANLPAALSQHGGDRCTDQRSLAQNMGKRPKSEASRQICGNLSLHFGPWRYPGPVDAMPVVIQSRGVDDADWSDEVWRRTQFEAYLLAMGKARRTGRIYRLVDQDGIVLEEVRQQGRIFRRGTQGSSCP